VTNELSFDSIELMETTQAKRNQEGTAYNGYFQCTFYHSLFCFNQFGDMEQAFLRKFLRQI
jgi:hypothetical protein